MIVEYAIWLNHNWLIQHVKNCEIYKPTDPRDPEYAERLKIWQDCLAIPSKLRDEIKLKHGKESIDRKR